jgi:hypothetical protein
MNVHRKVSTALFAIAVFQLIGATLAGREPRNQTDREMGIIWQLVVPGVFVVLGLWAACARPKPPGIVGFGLRTSRAP